MDREPSYDGVPPIPFDNMWLQQTLPSIQSTSAMKPFVAWLAFSTVLTTVMGTLIVVSTNSAVSVDVRYDHINRYIHPRSVEEQDALRSRGGTVFRWDNGTREYVQGVETVVDFEITEDMEPPIHMSYLVSNFLQNFRQYTDSVDDLQMLGHNRKTEDLVNCRPLRAPGELDESRNLGRQSLSIDGEPRLYGEMVYFPCGVGPWSMFNDSFTLYRRVETTGRTELICNASDFDRNSQRMTLSAQANPCKKEGIAFVSDTKNRFKPTLEQQENLDHWTGRGRPNASDPYLRNGWYFEEPGHTLPDVDDEDFMVWNRIGILGDFRKMHRRITVPLPQGQYRLVIAEFFDTTSFSGEKTVRLRSRTWVGVGSLPMGYTFIGCGATCFVMAIAFYIRDSTRARPANLDNVADAEDEELPASSDAQ